MEARNTQGGGRERIVSSINGIEYFLYIEVDTSMKKTHEIGPVSHTNHKKLTQRD